MPDDIRNRIDLHVQAPCTYLTSNPTYLYLYLCVWTPYIYLYTDLFMDTYIYYIASWDRVRKCHPSRKPPIVEAYLGL